MTAPDQAQATGTAPVTRWRGRYRVVWIPGTDDLCGFCHCGASTTADDPAVLWAWLLGHPDGHGRWEPKPV